MCGILGAFNIRDENKFRFSLDKITHRGPDGFGIWQEKDNNLLLGHRRLSILDTSVNGSQPMHYLHYSITFNGEIYNFIEVKKELQGLGYAFRTESDTEVIMAAFDCWKEKCLTRFNGMWSFAIWDNRKKQLFISRDRIGKKPLFYAFTKKSFIFGSEMKAITPLLGTIEPSKEFHWCSQNHMNYETTEHSLIEGIKRFPAGSYAYIKSDDRSIKPVKYWDTFDNLVQIPKKYDEQVEQFREIFKDACRIRMRSDVPIGTSLSGGLDSSSVVSMLSEIAKGDSSQNERISGNWQHAFVACFKDSSIDERKYAEQVVNKVQIPAVYIEIDPTQGLNNLYDYLYYFEELYPTSPIPMMETYKAIRENGITVSIDGHGADELLAGYGVDVYNAFFDSGLNIHHIQNILRTYKGLVDVSESYNGLDLGWRDYKVWLTYILKKMARNPSLMVTFLKSTLKGQNLNPMESIFNRHLKSIFHESILPTLLRNYDRYSMANGIEVRSPFLDHRLVSFAFSLPWASKLNGGFTKKILRDAMCNIMDDNITYRSAKIGFNTPPEWFKTTWRPFLMDTINSTDFKNSALVTDPAKAKKQVEFTLNSDKAVFMDSYYSWQQLTPYFWEKSFLERVQNQSTPVLLSV